MLNAVFSTGVCHAGLIHKGYCHSEPYRLALEMLRLKCIRSGSGIAATTEYTSTTNCYHLI
ncbi:MAG: hypothetical protein ACTS73_03515 [Arsenophonus sp. NEOnobi-MAG3]